IGDFTAGLVRMVVDTNGEVGIGTTSPRKHSRLEVVGSADPRRLFQAESGVYGLGGDAPNGAGGVGLIGNGGDGPIPGEGISAFGGDGNLVLGGTGIFAKAGNGPLPGFAAQFEGGVLVNDSCSNCTDGTVQIQRNLSVSGIKNFKIDHPLDPENKYL